MFHTYRNTVITCIYLIHKLLVFLWVATFKRCPQYNHTASLILWYLCRAWGATSRIRRAGRGNTADTLCRSHHWSSKASNAKSGEETWLYDCSSPLYDTISVVDLIRFSVDFRFVEIFRGEHQGLAPQGRQWIRNNMHLRLGRVEFVCFFLWVVISYITVQFLLTAVPKACKPARNQI